jgi:8-oxo-dGTP pyrophosphatase MutT (NUDIX family)
LPDERSSETRTWGILARKLVYDSDWVRMHRVDVRFPDGTIGREIHLVDYLYEAAGVVPLGDDGRILLIDHYRFQTGTRGWEIPAGKIESNESPAEAVRRELREETGHQARELVELGRYHPSNGSSNQVFHVFAARGVEQVGDVEDTTEVSGLQWFTPDQVRAMVSRNEILDGLSLTGLLWHFLQ